MNPNELLKYIKELIEVNEGVSVTSVRESPKYLELQITVTDAFSRLLVHALAEASNIDLALWVKDDLCSDSSKLNPEEGLIYAFTSAPDSNAAEEFCWLGAHLAWIMYRCDLISANEEKRYCEIFGAASRSA